jgi:hypothetical protein
MPAHELNTQAATALLLGIPLLRVRELVGEPDAIIEWTDLRSVPAWLSGRLDVYRRTKKPVPPPSSELVHLYSMRAICRRLDLTHYKARELLGDPDCVLKCLRRDYPAWSGKSFFALDELVNASRAAGERRFVIQRQQRRQKPRIQRKRKLFRISTRAKPLTAFELGRVTFCKPRHVWADPKAVELCKIAA